MSTVLILELRQDPGLATKFAHASKLMLAPESGSATYFEYSQHFVIAQAPRSRKSAEGATGCCAIRGSESEFQAPSEVIVADGISIRMHRHIITSNSSGFLHLWQCVVHTSLRLSQRRCCVKIRRVSKEALAMLPSASEKSSEKRSLGTMQYKPQARVLRWYRLATHGRIIMQSIYADSEHIRNISNPSSTTNTLFLWTKGAYGLVVLNAECSWLWQKLKLPEASCWVHSIRSMLFAHHIWKQAIMTRPNQTKGRYEWNYVNVRVNAAIRTKLRFMSITGRSVNCGSYPKSCLLTPGSIVLAALTLKRYGSASWHL